MKASFVRIVLCCAGLPLTSASAGAGVIYQTGFESPAFSTGPIGGQDGWLDNGSGNTVIQSSVAASGSQALNFLGTTFQYADHPFTASVAGQAFTFEADYLHSGTNTSPQSSMGTFGDNQKFIAQLGYTNGGFFMGNTNTSTPNLPAASDVWHHLSLTLDFTTNTMSGTADGQSLGTLPINNAVPSTQLTLFSIQFAGGTQTGNYWDNAVVSSVPEPHAAALLAIAALAPLRRRRARRA